MESKEFSQLPVMRNLDRRSLRGYLSWKTIGKVRMHRPGGRSVSDWMGPEEEVKVLRSSATLLEAVKEIYRSEFILVQKDDTIAGLVTAADITASFREQAEPFFLIGEIEYYLRLLIGQMNLCTGDLQDVRRHVHEARPVEALSDLQFSEYLALLASVRRWPLPALPEAQPELCAHLREVNRIRNEVMHFRPGDHKRSDIESLRRTARYVRKLLESDVQQIE